MGAAGRAHTLPSPVLIVGERTAGARGRRLPLPL